MVVLPLGGSSLRKNEIPDTLLSQYLPSQYGKVREGALGRDPEDLIRDRVREVIADYACAAGMGGL